MDNFTEFLQRQSRTLTAALGRLGDKLTGFSRSRGVNPAIPLTAIGLLFVGAVGVINLHTVAGLNFEFFYLLGCALVGWAAGTRAALVCTLTSGIFLHFAEVTSGVLPAGGVFALNSAARLTAFAFIGWLAAGVGRATRNQERTLEQRTARLQDVVAEHKKTAESLGKAMQLLQQVMENISDVFWVTDPEKTRVDYVSPKFENVWGQTCKRLYQSPSTWLEGVHHEDRERVRRAALAKQVTGEYDEEYRVVRPDGSVRWVHDRAFPVKNHDGSVYRIVGNTEDITERKRNERFLQVQRDMGIALGSTSQLGFALERLLEIALQLEGIDCGGVYLMDPVAGELRLEAHRGLSPAFVKRISHYKTDTTEARLVKAGRIEYFCGEQIPRSLEMLWGSEGLRALAVVPVQHKGEVLGMLNLGSYRNDEIPPKTRVAIELLGTQAAGAIARIRAEESLRQSEANLRAIIHSAPVALMAGDRNGIILFEDGRALEAAGVQPGENVGRPAAAVYAGFPEVAGNIQRALAGEEFRSVLQLGPTFLECHYTPTRDPQAGVTGFLSIATNVTERVRLERQILEISDREQARIGQDLHDSLCQKLVSLAFDCNSLEQKLAARALPEAGAVRPMADLLDDAITEARALSRGLFPVQLETDGLGLALKHLAASVSARFKLDCRLDCPQPVLVRDNVRATHLYRIAQEAVNNALKHGQAGSVTIQLSVIDDCLALKISDDGVGIIRPSGSTGGLGLHIMDYRARTIGGTLSIERGPKGGTVVSCLAPQQSI